MKRREFLAAACAAGPMAWRAWSDDARDIPKDIRITRVVGFDVESRRSKIAGKNARLDVHGDRATDRMARVYTNAGVDGVGNCAINQETGTKLLGKDPSQWSQEDHKGELVNLVRNWTMPFWDLYGKLVKKPIYELLGGAGPRAVPVYDGSIYFADLLPQYADHWQDRFRTEIDMGLEVGHRAFKVKIGRGAKWMSRKEGDARDVEVLQVVRKHAGDDIVLAVDANNGYDLAGTKEVFRKIGPLNIAFAEEMFEEQVDQDLEFKAFLRENRWKTLVADGETQGDLEVFRPFMKARAIDIYQADMNRFGFEGILTEAAWAAEHELHVAPHNWGSLVGFYMQLQVGRAIRNLYRAEHDPLRNDVLIANGYAIKDGSATLPNAPGAGLEINEDRFATETRIRFDVSL